MAAAMLQRLGIEYVALVPGASFRGLHDSLVNYLGNTRPGIIVCNHEEVSVSVAHGFAKASGRAMAAAVHSNVGLMHASMAIFNAWVDRSPVFIVGGTGPMDSTRRRPWIDWLHTSQGQGEIVRDFTKWEHQPASVAAIPEAMLRAWNVMHAEPRGPVYLNLDVTLQEQRMDPAQPTILPDLARYPEAAPPSPNPAAVAEAAELLVGADWPVVLVGRGGQSADAWEDLVALAELLGAAVLSDLKQPASFPTSHYLHQAAPSFFGDEAFHDTLRRADTILALNWLDVAGTVAGSGTSVGFQVGDPPASPRQARLVTVSLEDYSIRSWSAEYFGLPAADVPIRADVVMTVSGLLAAVRERFGTDGEARQRAERRRAVHRSRRRALEVGWSAARAANWNKRPIDRARLIGELASAFGDRQREVMVARGPLTWPPGVWEFTRPGSYLGFDGGAGIGSGPGMAVGAALAQHASGRPVVAVLGDGDLLMGNTALWTAAHHRLPLLIVVANNRTYFNDEQHQERMARARNRPLENRGIGQRMDKPPVNFAGLARDLGVEGFGPVEDPGDLAAIYAQALRAVDEGRPALVDVLVASL